MSRNKSELLSWDEFKRVEMRVGRIQRAEVFEEARNPAIKLWIDFGTRGILKSSAQICKRYSPERLIGQQVVAVVNFPPKQIANFMSECLVLGALGDGGEVILLGPDSEVKEGSLIA